MCGLFTGTLFSIYNGKQATSKRFIKENRTTSKFSPLRFRYKYSRELDSNKNDHMATQFTGFPNLLLSVCFPTWIEVIRKWLSGQNERRARCKNHLFVPSQEKKCCFGLNSFSTLAAKISIMVSSKWENPWKRNVSSDLFRQVGDVIWFLLVGALCNPRKGT